MISLNLIKSNYESVIEIGKIGYNGEIKKINEFDFDIAKKLKIDLRGFFQKR